jgi:hypothetical protein
VPLKLFFPSRPTYRFGRAMCAGAEHAPHEDSFEVPKFTWRLCPTMCWTGGIFYPLAAPCPCVGPDEWVPSVSGKARGQDDSLFCDSSRLSSCVFFFISTSRRSKISRCFHLPFGLFVCQEKPLHSVDVGRCDAPGFYAVDRSHAPQLCSTGGRCIYMHQRAFLMKGAYLMWP